VGLDGKPSGADVMRSSGSKRLDDAAVSYAIDHYRWEKPEKNCIAIQRPITIIWQLGTPPKAEGAVLVPASSYPAEALRLDELGDTYLAISSGEDGTIRDIQVAYTSGYAELDNQSVGIAKASPNLMSGKPSGTHTLLFRWRLPAGLNGSRITITSQALHMKDALRQYTPCEGRVSCKN